MNQRLLTLPGSLLTARFFDPQRYDMAPVGRYKTNKKLMLKYRLLGQRLAETLADPDTGEVLAADGDVVTKEVLKKLEPYLDRDDFKMITYTPSDEAVVTEPVKTSKRLSLLQ